MLLELQSIRKHFGGVYALRNGTLRVDSGQVHALVGENGAGKSTLMKVVCGMERRDGGDMRWQGESVDFAQPAEAHAMGIRMVHQESLLVPHLTVAQNIFLGCERMHGIRLDRRGMIEGAEEILQSLRFPVKGDWSVHALSPAQKQIVEICRALHGKSSLLIFDEPTSSLSDTEASAIFRTIRALRGQGLGIIYITHRLAEIQEIADQVTILRDGSTTHACPAAEITTEEIVRHMIGRDVSATAQRDKLAPGATRLQVNLPGAEFELRAGEIVGLAGLVGAGRTEMCETIFGITPAGPGTIIVNGQPADIRSPHDAVAAGIALVTEDRQRTGLATELKIRTNITLANLAETCTAGVVQVSKEKGIAERFRKKLRLQADSVEQKMSELSGGNQQKVVIAKWMFRDADVVLFDEPTRGIDVGAKAEVFALMDELARQGKALLMVSSELPELLQVADRILVMRAGEIAAELPRGTTQEQIMSHAVTQ